MSNGTMRKAARASALLFIAAILVALAPLGAAAQDRPDALAAYFAGRDLESRGAADAATAKYKESVAICDAELAQNDRKMDAYVVKCWSLLRLRQYKDVLDSGTRALGVMEDLRILESMGEAYFLSSYDFASCLRYMQRFVDRATAIGKWDRVSVAYFYMGEVYRNWKRYNLADLAYSAAIDLSGADVLPIWYLQAAFAKELLGDYPAAYSLYVKAQSGYARFGAQDKATLDAGLSKTQKYAAGAQ
jgi:tetratricopeptide (TPR) repeat protein